MNERPTPTPDPSLIHCCCDGELSPEQAATLEQILQAHPDIRVQVQRQIEQQQFLKKCVERSMRSACPCAPGLMAENIRAALRRVHGQRRERSRVLRLLFANPQRANVLAVAATLMFIAGAVLFGIFGQPIDQVRAPMVTDLISDAALFADQEHRECARDARGVPIKIHDWGPSQAEYFLSRSLGTAVNVFDLRDIGYEFVGAGESGMPIPARSGHLVYRKIVEEGTRAPMLSVFVVADQGTCRGKLCEGLDQGKWCCVSQSGVKCKRKVVRGTDGRLVYFLVCCVDGELDRVMQQIQLADSGSTR